MTRNFQHTFSPKATLLHSNLKRLNNIIRQTKLLSPIHLLYHTHLNNIINEINTSHQLNILPIPTEYNLLNEWITTTNTEWKTLYHARNLRKY